MTLTPSEQFVLDAERASVIRRDPEKSGAIFDEFGNLRPVAEVVPDLADLGDTRIPTADPSRRHVLVIEPTGLTYIAPHTPEVTARHREQPLVRGERLCAAVAIAFDAWREARHDGFQPEDHPDEGRWWCDVSEDGVFEVGGRVEP